MGSIQECAMSFQTLLNYEYHFIIGRKGQLKEFRLTFDKSDFHHLIGLHKLKDIAQIQHGMREKVFDKLISGEILETVMEKSLYYEQMESRIVPLTSLEELLDGNNLIFRYNEKIQRFSLIKAEYLIEGKSDNIPSFLFLGKRNDDENEQMCRTFFRVGEKDYTVGQSQYTLLKKSKINLITGEVNVQYDRLSPKEEK